jgi:osmotically-inducible protein OsmY
MFQVSASLCLGLILTGCAADSPGAAAPKAAEKRYDSEIVNEVRDKIQKDSRLQGAVITVTCDAGTVILSGKVSSREQFGTAQVVAAGTKGSKGVINRLLVTPPPDPNAESLPDQKKP